MKSKVKITDIYKLSKALEDPTLKVKHLSNAEYVDYSLFKLKLTECVKTYGKLMQSLNKDFPDHEAVPQPGGWDKFFKVKRSKNEDGTNKVERLEASPEFSEKSKAINDREYDLVTNFISPEGLREFVGDCVTQNESIITRWLLKFPKEIKEAPEKELKKTKT
jgi:hypothetical protein